MLAGQWHSAKVPHRPNRLHWNTQRGWAAAGTARAGRRLRRGLWPVVQTAVAAGLSWYLARDVIGNPQPFFAPIAATVSLSASSILRGQRALQLIGGVALGIGIGTGFEHLAGTGSVALGAAVLVALAVALAAGGGFFGQGLMFVNQTGASAVLVIALHSSSTGSERLADALVGGGVAVVVSVLLFPTAPMPLLDEAGRSVLGALRDALAGLEERLGPGYGPEDPGWPLAASQRIHQELAGLVQALSSARDIVRLAPRRWPMRPAVGRAGEWARRCDGLADSVLSLVRATDAAAREPGERPERWRPAIHELAAAVALLAQRPHEGAGGMPAWRQSAARPAVPTASDGTHAALVTSLADACWRDLAALVQLEGSPPASAAGAGGRAGTSNQPEAVE